MSPLPDHADLWQQTLNWQPDSIQQAQFQRLYDRILDGNRSFNLTRITEPSDFWEKHLWDSVRAIKNLLQREKAKDRGQKDREQKTEGNQEFGERGSEAGTVIDIGTGAGFPGIPIAIALPHWQITLLDSTRKKIDFLAEMLPDIPLAKVTLLLGRAEEIGQQRHHRERYDLATLRAVSSAATCAEYALPLVKVGGYAILYRGHWSTEETDVLEGVVAQLGGTVEAVEQFATPITQGDRHCLYLRKVAPTPSLYPRLVGLPAQSPLV
jgi:16S rRNA (guanine527-N7)-methyltransferase